MRPRAGLLLALSAALAGRAAAQGARPSPADDFVRKGASEPFAEPLASPVERIRAEALAAHVAFLASPALEGRGLGSRGLDAALAYAAAQLALAGIPPLPGAGGGPGALAPWFQLVPARELRDLSGAVEVERKEGGAVRRLVFAHGVDVVVSPSAPRSLEAPVVYAGYGIRETSPSRDDYQGLDVRGSIVVVREGLPPGEAWRTKALEARYAAADAEERWAAKLETARLLGAAAVIGVEGDAFPARILGKDKPWTYAFRSTAAEPGPRDPLLVRVSPAVGAALLGTDGPGRPRALPGVRVIVRASGVERLVTSANVAGVLQGSDPELRREVVVLGAHADHLGTVDGKVHPGADDNASGTAALLEIARALSASPKRPKRSLVFVFWTGEEEDKIGSTWWVAHPLWPLERTTAYVNLDMIGHPWSREEIATLLEESGLPEKEAFLAPLSPADFVEPGVASFAPSLAPVLARAARGTSLALHLDRTDGAHGGSDYRPFARARVPFVRFFGNFFPAYHQPGDTAEALDTEQVLRVARLALATAWLVADR